MKGNACGTIPDELPFPVLAEYLTAIIPLALLAGAVIAIAAHNFTATRGTAGATDLAVAAASVAFCAYGFLGLKAVNSGQAAVVTLLGAYRGTLRRNGLAWVFPLCQIHIVDIRPADLMTASVKVDDAGGDPIEIVAIVVYRVDRPASLVFNIGTDARAFVKIQAESELRILASEFACGPVKRGIKRGSLWNDSHSLAVRLLPAVQSGVDVAGIVVSEARIYLRALRTASANA